MSTYDEARKERDALWTEQRLRAEVARLKEVIEEIAFILLTHRDKLHPSIRARVEPILEAEGQRLTAEPGEEP